MSGLTEVAFTNNLQELIFDGFSSARAQVAAILDGIQASIDALPAGPDQDKAQAGLDAAINSLNASQTALNLADFSTAAKALGSSLKSAAKVQKVVDQAGGGGGTCGTITTSTVMMTV